MSKGKSITLLSIISVLLAIVLVLTFGQFKLDKQGIKSYASLLGAVELDYDLEGGVAYTLKLSEDNEEEVTDINSVIDILDYRMSELGYGAYSVKAVKSADEDVLDYDIRIEAKETESIESDISVVTAYGTLHFYGGESASPTDEILEDIKVIKDAKYTGATTSDGTDTIYGVSLEFTKEGYDALIELIESAESSYYVEIKLGETVLLSGSSAISKEYFNNKTLAITSSSEASAKQMALQMKNGGLAYKYTIDSAESITSPYGNDIAEKCAVAIITLVVIALALMIILYKGFGVITALSTLLFILGEGWLLIGVPGIVLSMGGVVGIMAATLVASLSMSIVASRVKEEFVNSKKTVKAAVKKAFKSSLVPTINLNVVCGVVALALFVFANGLIKNFAITFGIGVAVSVISALVFTRMFTSIILPIVANKEKFIGFKRQAKAIVEESEEA